MGTRIRYRETGVPGVVESVKRYPHETSGAVYRILVNKPELAFQIIEETAGNVVADGKAVNLHQVKIKAKNTLIDLGIKFDEKEVRTRKVAEVS